MVPGSVYYEHGATARKIQYDVYKENSILRSKRKRIKYTRVKTKLLLFMCFVFMLGMALIYRYSIIQNINYQIDESKNTLSKLRNENVAKRIKIENALDLSHVREVAEGKYAMHKPLKEQTVFINVPKSDYLNKNLSDNGAKQASENAIEPLYAIIAKNIGLIK